MSFLPPKDDNPVFALNWYVLYTCPRAEKVVYSDLLDRGYDTFLPMIKTLKEYKCRHRKWIDEVLFPGYIFVKSIERELYRVKQVPKVVTYIHCAGKPSKVSEKHIETIKRMLGAESEIFVETELFEEEEVRILSGPFAGYEGIIINRKGKTLFGVQLKEINRSIFVDLTSTVVEKVESTTSSRVNDMAKVLTV